MSRQRITEGTVYRRIPDWPSHFDHAAGRPTYLAFMPRPRDRGAVSLLLKGLVTEDKASRNPQNPGDRTFGLCELDVAQIREWKVEDRASYELVRAFYRHLESAGTAEALRQAQLETMRTFPHPFAWAAFGLTGVPR